MRSVSIRRTCAVMRLAVSGDMTAPAEPPRTCISKGCEALAKILAMWEGLSTSPNVPDQPSGAAFGRLSAYSDMGCSNPPDDGFVTLRRCCGFRQSPDFVVSQRERPAADKAFMPLFHASDADDR